MKFYKHNKGITLDRKKGVTLPKELVEQVLRFCLLYKLVYPTRWMLAPGSVIQWMLERGMRDLEEAYSEVHILPASKDIVELEKEVRSKIIPTEGLPDEFKHLRDDG